jgi:hypothetical protein
MEPQINADERRYVTMLYDNLMFSKEIILTDYRS